jgi:D-glycero-D-manno-heptose 1,7-bisphosphate phosphatase
MKVLFLDRDGVINIDLGYVHKIEKFDFIKGIFELCQLAQKQEFKIIIVTNQSGIARGYYSEEDFNILTTWMKNEFSKNSIDILDVLYCPHHIDKGIGKYKLDCLCRKPLNVMFLHAKAKYDINLEESVMIGDKTSDLIASSSAGVLNNILIESKYEKNDIKEL